MSNPNGPYPGRQLFVGLSADNRPAIAYLVTGRNPKSRERLAVAVGDGIRIGPIGQQEYDPLRHYTGVKFENLTGIAVVSNGIQTEAIFETYRLLYHAGSPPDNNYLEKIMDGARYEPDSLNTPRIAGVITNQSNEAGPVYIISIITHYSPAKAFRIEPKPATLTGVATYRGEIENPEPFDTGSNLPEIEFSGKTARELADYLYEISAESYKGDDIRVCTIGGVRLDNNTWDLVIKNRHE